MTSKDKITANYLGTAAMARDKAAAAADRQPFPGAPESC